MERQPIMILADPSGKAWNFAERVHELLKTRTSESDYQLGAINLTNFSDGEIYMRIKDNVRKRKCYFIHDSSIYPQDWLVSLGLANDAMMRSSAGEINDVLPYMKYGRQDRISEPRTPVSSSFLAEIINMHADRVLTTDHHSPATIGSYKIPFDNLRAFPVMINHITKRYEDFLSNAIVVAPDAGSTKIAESYAKRLGLSFAITDKKREKAGVIEKMTLIGEVSGKNVLLVDDMIDTAGTLCKSAEVLKQKGALDIYACATHGLFSRDAKEKIHNSSIEKIVISDSIPQDSNGKIEKVSLANLFAETIYRINHGDSISELFG